MNPNQNGVHYFGHGTLFTRAAKKYGIENFARFTLRECKSIEEMNTWEPYWIKKLDSTNKDIGYNIMPGGRNSAIAESSKKKMSDAKKGYVPWLVGKKHRPESKKKMSDAHKGKVLSKEHRENLGKARLGKLHTEETKRKISDAHLGEKHWSTKLTENDVLEIRRLYSTGNYTQDKIGLMYGIARSTVSGITERRRWKHI